MTRKLLILLLFAAVAAAADTQLILQDSLITFPVYPIRDFIDSGASASFTNVSLHDVERVWYWDWRFLASGRRLCRLEFLEKDSSRSNQLLVLFSAENLLDCDLKKLQKALFDSGYSSVIMLLNLDRITVSAISRSYWKNVLEYVSKAKSIEEYAKVSIFFGAFSGDRIDFSFQQGNQLVLEQAPKLIDIYPRLYVYIVVGATAFLVSLTVLLNVIRKLYKTRVIIYEEMRFFSTGFRTLILQFFLALAGMLLSVDICGVFGFFTYSMQNQYLPIIIYQLFLICCALQTVGLIKVSIEAFRTKSNCSLLFMKILFAITIAFNMLTAMYFGTSSFGTTSQLFGPIYFGVSSFVQLVIGSVLITSKSYLYRSLSGGGGGKKDESDTKQRIRRLIFGGVFYLVFVLFMILGLVGQLWSNFDCIYASISGSLISLELVGLYFSFTVSFQRRRGRQIKDSLSGTAELFELQNPRRSSSSRSVHPIGLQRDLTPTPDFGLPSVALTSNRAISAEMLKHPAQL